MEGNAVRQNPWVAASIPKLSNLRIGSFSFSVSGIRFPGIGRAKTVLGLPQKRAIFSEGDFHILPLLSSALVAAAASATGSLSAMTCRRDWALRDCAYGVFFAPEGISTSIQAGGKEICEFKSQLDDFGLRIQGWGFSSSA